MNAPTPTRTPRTTATATTRRQKTRAEHLNDHLVLLHAALADLHDALHRAADLVDTRQAPTVSFLTPTAREQANKTAKAERAARHAAALAGVKIPGETPAPLNVAAVSIEEETRRALAAVVDELVDDLHRAGVCWVGEAWWALLNARKGERTRTRHRPAHDLARDVAALARLVARPARLAAIHRTVEDLATRARRVVDGEERTTHPDPCPWCHRRTLVAYLNRGVIRCEHDPHTNNLERCTCTDAYCPCHHDRGYRHEWNRAERGHKATSYQGLRRDQAAAARHQENEITAQAALDRIRALHVPYWTTDDGARYDHLVTVPWDQAPTGHQCIEVGHDRCYPDELHMVPGCVECRCATDDYEAGYQLWPCATVRLIENPDRDLDEDSELDPTDPDTTAGATR